MLSIKIAQKSFDDHPACINPLITRAESTSELIQFALKTLQIDIEKSLILNDFKNV